MYKALWRILPGTALVRVLILLAGLAALGVVLDQWVFPWVATTFVDSSTTIGRG
ncbi:hypothetical protein SCMU_28880 [Sinomonas cyclohexanicum]|uniref:Uncharacterized protein n=1 Tax=Sinomonas cyclohexanicum TaxID=322009 RepID=A0ABM7PXL2_SINCY|nr:hypothetical protein [Corynebacterium cyclohexanicum]BCT77046.1 hypothetical protein SCMU_28880 [Corynebacterium cyclohexanicum]